MEENNKKLEEVAEKIKKVKDKDSQKKEELKFWSSISLVFSLGFTFIASLVSGFFVGDYLDKKFSSFPTYTLTFLLIGIIGGGYAGYKLLSPYL